MTKILYTSAIDEQGNLITANDAEKGKSFFCPICETDVILRKSGNVGKGAKRPHFAHRALTSNCNSESVLHYSFKKLLFDKIEQHLKMNKELLISWDCKYCKEKHSGNLLKKIKDVKLEYDLKICRPDIALLDIDKKVFAVIEIVVTHKPENSVLEFYKDNNIILIQIDLTSDNDIYELDDKLSNLSKVSVCFNPKCEICGDFKMKKTMMIIESDCWRCRSNMKVAAIHSDTRIKKISHNLCPSDFTEKEINFARSKGVTLSAEHNGGYIASCCGKCGAFVGDHYLFTDYIAPVFFDQLLSQNFDMGYHCWRCDK